MSVPPPQTAPPAPSDHVSEGFQWWAPFAALVAAVGVSLVLTAIVAGATGNLDESDRPPGLLLVATFIQDIALVAASFGIAAVAGARVRPALFGLRRFDRRRAIGPSALAFVTFFVFLVAWSQLQPDAEQDLLDDLGAKQSTLLAVGTGVLVCIMAPIAEEIFFRGYLFRALQGSMRWVPAAILSGIVFGGIHLGTPLIFLVPLAVLGFLLCVLYRRTGSLLPGMGVHAFNNALTLGVGLSLTVGQTILIMLAAPLVVIAIVWPVAD